MNFLAPMARAPGLALHLVKAIRLSSATVRKSSALGSTGEGILALTSLLVFLACTGDPAPIGDSGPGPTPTSESQAPAIPSPTPATELPGTPKLGPAPVPNTVLSQGTPVATIIPIPPTPVPTELPDRNASTATDEEFGLLVAGNSAFALDLYRALSAEEGNLFFSPYSISQAVAMTYAGARGETERQMADTLPFHSCTGHAASGVQLSLPVSRLPRRGQGD